jgi:low temperature requirement protein LtrA
MRDHGIHDRPSTPLELLFDLCFVVAVAFLAAELHHGVAAAHSGSALTTYLLLFIPVWWAWMSYSWYATAFSHDEPIQRLLTGAQMLGVLGVAAAVPSAASGDPIAFAVTYAVMRLPLIAQWVRSGVADRLHRAFALTYAVGSAIAQVLWVFGALLPGLGRWGLFALALMVELATPMLAVRRSPDRVFHPGHIAERYGLFTIIVLGESILAVSLGLREVVGASALAPDALIAVIAVLAIAFALWWLYFDTLGADALVRNRQAAFAWGYGHYAIFAGVAAIGAGARVVLDALTDAEAHGGAVGDSGVRVIAGSVAVVLIALLVLARLSRPVPPIPALVGAAITGGICLAPVAMPPWLGLSVVAVVTIGTVGRQVTTHRSG